MKMRFYLSFLLVTIIQTPLHAAAECTCTLDYTLCRGTATGPGGNGYASLGHALCNANWEVAGSHFDNGVCTCFFVVRVNQFVATMIIAESPPANPIANEIVDRTREQAFEMLE